MLSLTASGTTPSATSEMTALAAPAATARATVSRSVAGGRIGTRLRPPHDQHRCTTWRFHWPLRMAIRPPPTSASMAGVTPNHPDYPQLQVHRPDSGGTPWTSLPKIATPDSRAGHHPPYPTRTWTRGRQHAQKIRPPSTPPRRSPAAARRPSARVAQVSSAVTHVDEVTRRAGCATGPPAAGGSRRSARDQT